MQDPNTQTPKHPNTQTPKHPNSEHTAPVAEESAPKTVLCRCGLQVDANLDSCPTCGHSLWRICVCAKKIPRTALTCPHCGQDWSRYRRTRVKKPTKKERMMLILRYVLIGGFVGLVGGLVVTIAQQVYIYVFIKPPPGPEMPPQTFMDVIMQWGQNLAINVLRTLKDIFVQTVRAFRDYPLIGYGALGGIIGGGIYAYRRLMQYRLRRHRG